MTTFVCDDKNGTPLYVGDRVKWLYEGGTGIPCYGTMSDDKNCDRWECNYISNDDGSLVPAFKRELEKIEEVMMKKELKKFVLATANVGDKLIEKDYGDCIFVGVAPYANKDDDYNIVIETIDERLYYTTGELLTYQPLCYIEGQPMYVGDGVYYNGELRTITGKADDVPSEARDNLFLSGLFLGVPLTECSLTKPKVKMVAYANLYKDRDFVKIGQSVLYKTETQADTAKLRDRISVVKIEWEE